MIFKPLFNFLKLSIIYNLFKHQMKDYGFICRTLTCIHIWLSVGMESINKFQKMSKIMYSSIGLCHQPLKVDCYGMHYLDCGGLFIYRWMKRGQVINMSSQKSYFAN